MKAILDAILADDTPPEAVRGPARAEHYRAVTVHEDEQQMFAGLATRDKDPRKSLHVEDVATPSWVPVRR
jgi:crotonyl-CoA reductase